MTQADTLKDKFWKARNALGFEDGANRAALAALRRLHPQVEAVDRIDPTPLTEVPAAMLLLKQLGLSGEIGGMHIERAAAALSVLASITKPDTQHPAVALRYVMSEDRFIRLLRMETPAELLVNGRRAVRMLKGKADPGRLGADLYLWGPRVRTRWAFLYHGASMPDALADEHESGDAA